MRAAGVKGLAQRTNSAREAHLRAGIIAIGRQIARRRLAVGRCGNISCRCDARHILITATGCSLGDLRNKDIVKVSLRPPYEVGNPPPSSEFHLHRLIHLHRLNSVILHCHPPLTNAYFTVYSGLKPLTFEGKAYVGRVPVVDQSTPTVTRPAAVVAALRNSNLVVLRNHGAVAIGDTFRDALFLIETLEEAVKTVSIARLFKKKLLDGLEVALQGSLVKDGIHAHGNLL